VSKAVFSMVDEEKNMGEGLGVVRVLKYSICLLILCLLGGAGYWAYCGGKMDFFGVSFRKSEEKFVPDRERYAVMMKDLARWREDLAGRYARARTAEGRGEVEHDARVILEKFLPEMMRCWRGTAYDFNGVAEGPGDGGVACGYFVSTVLRDAGFKVNRYTLAQQPSANIMRSFVEREACELRVGVGYEEYVDWFENQELGIYLMGLDTHVGFVVNEGEGMRFLHSSGIEAAGVVEETRGNANAIKWSNWRMLGRFSGEPKVIRMWLKGEKVQVVQ
jgi:hypothetical protein